MSKTKNKTQCYSCGLARRQGGSAHYVCPYHLDFDPRLLGHRMDGNDCPHYIERENDTRASYINAFKFWSGGIEIEPE